MSPPLVPFALGFVGVAVASAVGCGWVRRSRLLGGPLDVPNERSSHTAPTPRGGGLVIAAFALLTLLLTTLAGTVPSTLGYATFAGGAAIMASSWRNDRAPLTVPVRLLIQVLAAALVVAALGGVPSLRLGHAHLALGAAGGLLAGLGLVWFTNLYNFMDGIDGLAGGQGVVGGLFLALVLGQAGLGGWAAVAGVVAASSLGFLYWNRPPARLFMGDVGSCTLGYLFGAMVLIAERAGAAQLLLLLLPFAAFILDASATLLRRLLRGEGVTTAHRTHVYQRLVRRAGSHTPVTLLALVLALVLALLALATLGRPGAVVPVTAAGVLLVAGAGWAGMRLLRAPGEP